jgi:hypothetical protein
MIVVISILSVLVVVLGFTTFNLLKKNEKAEDLVVSYEKHINEIDSVIAFINKRMQEIDAKGTFSSDDEVGFFFERLKLLDELLKEYRLKR